MDKEREREKHLLNERMAKRDNDIEVKRENV